MGRVIAIVNPKGGVGKTTTAINLSACLGKLGKKVLAVDFDPQANCSIGFNVDPALVNKSVFDVLVSREKIDSALVKEVAKNVDLLPSKLELANIDAYLNINNKRNLSLFKYALNKIKNQYDYVLIDCPPSMGFLSQNAFVASDSVLITIQCQYFALEAATQILASISRIQSTDQPKLGIEGFLLTMYDSKNKLDTEIYQTVRSLFKENTFATSIPRNISLPESMFKHTPVIFYRPNSKGALAYLSLAKEIIEKNEANPIA